MKTTITGPSSIKHTFPAFYKETGSELVVLFARLHTGIVVHGSGCYDVGDWDDDWTAADESEWTRLPAGTVITLEQT